MAEKARYFDFITYESIEVIEKVLKQEGGDYLISPLHKPDEEGKKPHYHVMYCHGNTITLKCAKDIILPLGLAVNGKVIMIVHPPNRQRYYLHLDDPEKEQFPDGEKLLKVIRNFPLDLKKPLSAEEKRQLPKRVLNFIRDFSISEYKELVDALANYDDDMFDFAYTHTIFLGRYLDSKRYGGSGEEK